MQLKVKLDQLSSTLTKVAQDAYPKAGRLKSSIKVEIKDDDITISFENYGLAQDSGVQGAFGESRHPSGQGYNKWVAKYKPVKDKFGRPAPVGGPLSWGARVNIRKFGIPARPWIAKMISNIEAQIAKDIEVTLPPQIEQTIAKLLGTIK